MKRLVFILLGILLLLGVAVLPAAAEDATAPEPTVQTQEEIPPLSPYEAPDRRDYEGTDLNYDSVKYNWEASLIGTYYRWTRKDNWGNPAKFDRAFRQFYADDPLLMIENHIVYMKKWETNREGQPVGDPFLVVLDYFDTDEAEAETTMVTVPAVACGLPVKDIYMWREYAAGGLVSSGYYNDTIKTLVVKAPLQYIKAHTFSNMTALEKINLTRSGGSFGNCAFYNCKALRRLVCKKEVKLIGDEAFKNCEQLDYRVSPWVVQIGRDAFRNSGIKKLELPLSVRLERFDPDSAGDAAYAFADCKKLTSVCFTGGKNTRWYQLPYAMFSGCTALQTVRFTDTDPEDARLGLDITWRCFSGCTALQTVVLPAVCKWVNIYENAFEGCTALQKVAQVQNVKRIYQNAFLNCSALQSFVVSQEIEFAEDDAFKGCTGLQRLYVHSKNPDLLKYKDYDDGDMRGREISGNFLVSLPDRCTIFVANKEMKYVFKTTGCKGDVRIRVTVPAPKTARMTRQNGKVRFVWSTVTKADGYRIWSYDARAGKYTRLATVKAPKTSVTLKTNARQFVIRAYQKEAGDVSWSAVKTFK